MKRTGRQMEGSGRQASQEPDHVMCEGHFDLVSSTSPAFLRQDHNQKAACCLLRMDAIPMFGLPLTVKLAIGFVNYKHVP